MDPITPTHNARKAVAILAALALIASASWVAWHWYVARQSRLATQAYNAGAKAFSSRDFEKAAAQYKTAVQTSVATSTEVMLTARFRESFSLFNTYDPQKQTEAITSIKQVIDESKPYPRLQAQALHLLKDFNCISGRDPAVFGQIYSGDYAKFLNEPNKARTVRDLLLKSYDVYPDARVAGEIAANYGIELVENPGLTVAEKVQYTKNVLDWQKKADALYVKTKYDARNQMVFYSWMGYAYGALALSDPKTYGPLFEKAFENAINIPGSQGFSVEVRPGQIEQFSRFYYAYFLARVYGSSRYPDARAQADALMKLVKADPMPATNEFLAGIRVESKKDASLIGKVYELAVYPYAKEIIQADPAFKDLLHQYGYTLL